MKAPTLILKENKPTAAAEQPEHRKPKENSLKSVLVMLGSVTEHFIHVTQ